VIETALGFLLWGIKAAHFSLLMLKFLLGDYFFGRG